MYREQKRYGMEPSEVVRAAPKTFNLPKRLKPGQKVFVCSWSDFFHVEADPWRSDAWDLIRERPDLTFQLCTKRIERVEAALPTDWPFENVWLGVTAENHTRADERIPQLLQIPALVHFVSVEPMLTPIALTSSMGSYIGQDIGCLPAVDWVIVGGESGPKARPMFNAWARDLRDQCKDAGTAFFMKQLGGWPNKRDRMADFPEDLRIREFPGAQ
jgi:protein gp37